MASDERFTILLIDDDPDVLDMLRELFCDQYETLLAKSGPEAVECVKAQAEIAAVVLDMKMSGMDGTATYRAIRELRPELPVIIHTGYPGEFDEAKLDVMLHPFDYVQKGRSIHRLERQVRNACETTAMRRQAPDLAARARAEFGMVGRAKGMLDVYKKILRIGPTDMKALIVGETGTGKELVAKALWMTSSRREKPFEILTGHHKNAELVESELFGHVRGAFTGATTDRTGIFEFADGGTVFLDEIGDLDTSTQAKVLRVIETGEYQPIGKPGMKHADVRIISATNRNLAEMVKQGQFREDLYYRLQEVQIALPPLRERREDIPLLLQHFTDWYCADLDAGQKVYESDARFRLIEYDWPGNVRQLRHIIRRLIYLTDDAVITVGDVTEALCDGKSKGVLAVNAGRTLAERVREFKRICIIEALAESQGNIAAAARTLAVDRSNLRKLMDDLGIT